jgi:hypothetical protein
MMRCRSIKHTYKMNAKNGNNLRANAMKKEITNVGVAETDKQPPPGWSKVSGLIIFDVKGS